MSNSKEEIIDMARQFRFGSDEEKKYIIRTITSLDDEGLVDFLESSREIMYENSGDEESYHMMYSLIEYIHAEQSSRITGNMFGSITGLIKKWIK